jgi:virginiamycin B lyase
MIDSDHTQTNPARSRSSRRMRGRSILSGSLLAVCLAFLISPAAPFAHSSVAASCPAGSVPAVISGTHTCLKSGQRCLKRLDRQYDRYGFRCESGRLSRRSRPKPPPAPAAVAHVSIALPASPGDTPEPIAIGEGSVWVGLHRAPELLRVDPETNTVAARIQLAGAACGIEVAYGFVWVGHCFSGRGVSQVDPQTNRLVATVATIRAADLASGAGSLWIADFDAGAVLRLDPATTAVVATINVGAEPNVIEFGFDSVWVVTRTDGTISRIDPVTNTVTTRIKTGISGTLALTHDDAAVWALNVDEGVLDRIDPETNSIKPVHVVAGGSWPVWTVAAGPGKVWARSGASDIAGVDPSTNTVSVTLTTTHTVASLAVGLGSLWATLPDDDQLWRITPTS